MKPEDRREQIAARVRESSRVTVDELAAALAISRETIRRDLALLSEQGVLRKVHGGAVHLQSAREGSLRDREARARGEKIAIGRAAARLFEPGDSIFIDAGTTTSFFAAELGKAGAFSVITNSLMVAAELWNAPHKGEVYLVGGRFNGDNQEIVGPLAVEQIHALHADHAVLTIGAMDQSGRCMDFNADEAFVARAMIARARRTTILADSSKLDRYALFEVCDAAQIDRLVTDRPIAPPLADSLRGAGVEIVLVR